jgi:hypothetical protein
VLLESFELRTNTLGAELGQVGRELAKGELDRACENLEDFASKARKESLRSLTPTQAEELVASAAEIESLLGC